ncbi:MAG: hypothetical protein AAF618_04845 [Pseudomonadota bacterium]
MSADGAGAPTRVFTVDDLDTFRDLCLSGQFSALVDAYVEPDQAFAPKKWSADLGEEAVMLLRQFGRAPALCFAVAMLTPYLRRKIDFEANYTHFNTLWAEHEGFLIEHLSARWLISTLDTYLKNPRTPAESAWAFCGAFMLKTIKLYETENLRQPGMPDLLEPPRGEAIDKGRDEVGRVMLFEGIQAYNVTVGDMVEKMERRLLSEGSPELCYKITCELWRRAHRNDTIYKRMADARTEVERRKAERARSK